MSTDLANSVASPAAASARATPRRVPFDAPWNWLAAGWRDLWTIPKLSLTYGAAFAIGAAVMAVLLWEQGWNSLFLALAGGFLLLGPLCGVGLYQASRKLAANERVTFSDMLSAGFSAKGQLSFFGAILAFCYLIWLQLAFLLLMLFLGGNGLPPASEFVPTLLFTPRGVSLLIVGSIVGGLIASTVFIVSVVSVPSLLVERTDAVSAARASVRAVMANPKPMALWAGLIAVMMIAGFATIFVGLILAFPLIGHATWHAYQDIYG